MTSEHFAADELKCRHCGVNMCRQELLTALEDLRALVGRPIHVNDAYRCPVHNAAVGGAPNSEHMLGLAADIRIEGMTPAEMYKVARQVPAFKGIGVAEHQNYIHVDVRAAEARWCYDATGKTCAWDKGLDA